MSVQVISEIGINHGGSLETALKMLDASKECGANFAKFQKRTISLCYTEEELAKPRESPYGKTNGDLKRALEFGKAEYDAIDAHCKKIELQWSASCWDIPSVEFIASYNPPFLKIPSALITNLSLVAKYVKAGIPLIISTGMSTWDEIDRCMFYATNVHSILHCHSSYPSPLEEVNLACITSFKERYPGVKVGYSSHTVSPWPCLMAVVYGAEVVEAHLTLDRTSFGTDQAASLEPGAFKKLVEEIRTWERCKGDGIKRVYPSEEPIKAKLRR
jgi:N-acetylneuraminate synthase